MNPDASLKIIFMGTPEFAVPALEHLHESGHQVLAVVTVPDRVQGRGRKARPSAVKQTAEALGLPIIQPENLKAPEFLQDITDLKPDLIVVVAFQILPEAIFTLPPFGSFNLHASLLPRYRGAAPIHWALLNGDQETGVTTFFLKRRVDTGNIIFQSKTAIDPEDTLETLYAKLRDLGAKLVLKTVDQIANGSVEEESQDNTLATPAPKVDASTQMLDFNQTAGECHNRIRAFSPKPGAFTLRSGARLKLINSGVTDQSGEPGEVIDISKDAFTLACGVGALVVFNVQPESKKVMPADAYLRGHPLKIGDRLGH